MPLSNSKISGLIIKGIGGFYYVEAADTVYECKARGIFRKNGLTPMAGDIVDILPASDGTATIDSIHDRKNYLTRPPVANIDQLLVIASTCDPSPSTLIIDKMIAAAENKEIEPVLVVSKTDMQAYDWLLDIYRQAGIPCVTVSSVNDTGINEVSCLLQGKVSVFTGNSGVGKSTLLNCIDSTLHLATGDISKKLGRGRHTTRQVELYKLPGGGYVADTPGFSTVDIERYELIKKENIQFCFREFAPYINECKFSSCSHTGEKGCAVLEAVERGIIHRSRYESFCTMYNEVKNIKEWEI